MRGAWLVALALAAGGASAHEARWYGLLENDVVFLTDRWYSHGVRVSRVQEAGSHEAEWSLVHEAYVPEAKHFRLGGVDRAPSARLLASYARHYRDAAAFQTIELSLGVRGPSAQGRRMTDLVHRIIAARRIEWSREGSDRVDAHVAAVRSHALGPINVHYGAVLGTELAFAHGTVELRIGESAGDTISPLLRYAVTPPFSRDRDARGWSAFAAMGARAVARNELLARGYDPIAPLPTRERLVGRLTVGVSLAADWGSVSFALAQDTREFEEQRTPQRFGSLGFNLRF